MPHCAFRFPKINHIISLFSATFSNLWNFVRLVNRQATNSPEFGICLGFFHDFARRSISRRGPSKSRTHGNSNSLPKLHRFAPQLYTGRNKPWYIYQHFRSRRTNRLTNRSFFEGKVVAECRVWRILYILSVSRRSRRLTSQKLFKFPSNKQRRFECCLFRRLLRDEAKQIFSLVNWLKYTTFWPKLLDFLHQ